MKKYLLRHRTNLVILVLFLSFAGFSFAGSWDFGLRTSESFAASVLELLSFLPAIFILIGLLDVWLPKDLVAKHTGETAAWTSALWMLLFASLQAGPLYGAFPVAYLLWKKGTSPRNIFIYLGAFTTMKLPLLGFEIGFLGLKFSLLRMLLSIPLFIVLAIILDKIYGKNFRMSDGSGFEPQTSAPSPKSV